MFYHINISFILVYQDNIPFFIEGFRPLYVGASGTQQELDGTPRTTRTLSIFFPPQLTSRISFSLMQLQMALKNVYYVSHAAKETPQFQSPFSQFFFNFFYRYECHYNVCMRTRTSTRHNASLHAELYRMITKTFPNLVFVL